MTPANRSRLGRSAEVAAAAYLEQHGYQILMSNYRGRRGEIDLVARDGPTIVFVEVKGRRAGVEHSLEAVDVRKRRRIVQAALEYISTRSLVGASVRFDVVAVVLGTDGRPSHVHVVKDAFSAGE